MADSKLNDIIRTSLDSIRELVDVNTVIGNPITAAGNITIIPVSKISVGFVSGGVDYYGKNNGAEAKQQNFGGGGGTGLSVSPVGFLVITSDGKVELLNMNDSAGHPDTMESISNLIEKSPDIIEKFRQLFKKENDAEE